jgi:hypothetical protein
MEDPNLSEIGSTGLVRSNNESQFPSGLRLPPRQKQYDYSGTERPSTKKNKIPQKPASPKDTTPIIVNGNPISREDLTPIVDQAINIQDAKIDLLENPSAINDIIENGSKSEKPTILTQIPKVSQDQSITRTKTTSQVIEEQLSQPDLSDPFRISVYDKAFDPEIPSAASELQTNGNNFLVDQDSVLQDTKLTLRPPDLEDIIPTKSYRRFNPPFPNNRIIGAYVESIESTDTSTVGPNIQPKITSPTDIFSVDTKSPKNSLIVDTRYDQHQRDHERREKERRDQEQRNQEQRDQERREKERRDQEKIEKERRDQERRDQEKIEKERRDQERRDQEKIEKERRDQERREKERRDQEQRDQERRGQERKEKEEREKKEEINKHEEKPLTREELVSRAQDCFLKYQILQKSWQEYKFPNMDEKLVQSNPQIVIDTYRISVERIQIDMDVNQYKIALIIMFLVIEVVSVKLLGLNAGGYTLSQIKAMNRYEKLLIEIGEKKMMIGGDSWPPEVRILFIGLFNCGLFILMKYLSSVLGPELVGYISPIVNGLFSGALDNSKTASLPDEIPQKQQDLSGMLGGVASMAAKALGGNQSAPVSNSQPRASRRPVYRE